MCGVNLAQWYWQILLALAPCVCAVAVSVRSKCRGCLAGAYKIPITLAFAHKLKMTLVDDVVDGGCTVVGQSCTVMNTIEIFLCLGLVTVGTYEQFGGIEQCLSKAIDAQVVVEVEVTVSLLVLVVLRVR